MRETGGPREKDRDRGPERGRNGERDRVKGTHIRRGRVPE
jgi:hypothetical protein